MKLFTITATPVQNLEQMVQAGYDISGDNSVEKINQLHLDEYADTVARILGGDGIDGFTMYQVQGYWRGVPEVSFKIEIAVDDKHWTVDGDVYSVTRRLEKVCEKLRSVYNQDSVMLTLPNNTVKFIAGL